MPVGRKVLGEARGNRRATSRGGATSAGSTPRSGWNTNAKIGLMKPNANPWDDKNQGYLKYVREGGEIFFQNCHFCHGDNLNGRGLHAFAFNPIPANFTDPGTIAQLQETFIFWRVSKGGIGLPNEGFPWASVMPPWEQHLTVDEIWKVILFEYWHTGYYPRTWD